MSRYLCEIEVEDCDIGVGVVMGIAIGIVETSLFLGCVDGIVAGVLAVGDCGMPFRLDDVNDGVVG